MISIILPKYVTDKELASGKTGFYWNCPTAYRKQGCPYKSAPLGINLSQKEIDTEAKVHNDRLDGWLDERSNQPSYLENKYGTVEWLVDQYLGHKSFTARVGEYSAPDYHRILKRLCSAQIIGESGKKLRIGDQAINLIGVSTAEKIYDVFAASPRTAEKLNTYCKSMWQRMRPHHIELFRSDFPNPWEGVTINRRTKKKKKHNTRKEVYQFAWGCVDLGYAQIGAAAVIAYEWLLRPSNISAGKALWAGYRSAFKPNVINVDHRKNNQEADHILETTFEDGTFIKFYEEAEAVLKEVPRYGLSIVCRPNGNLYSGTTLTQEVARLRKLLGMPNFTLDGARHGGLTELEEAGLTEGQGRVLSKHKTASAYRGYAKETEKRMLEATLKRFGHSEYSNFDNENNAKKLKDSPKS